VDISPVKVNEEDFFCYTKGIYIKGIQEWSTKANDLPWWEWPANYRQRGKEWERKAEISFIGFSQNTMVQSTMVQSTMILDRIWLKTKRTEEDNLRGRTLEPLLRLFCLLC